MVQWFAPVLLLATLLVSSESVSKKRENQYEINVRHGPYEIHQRHVNSKPFKRTSPNDEGAMDHVGYQKEASLSEEVVEPKKETRKYGDKREPKVSKTRGSRNGEQNQGSSAGKSQKKARQSGNSGSWGYGPSEFITTTSAPVRPQAFPKHRSSRKYKGSRRPHYKWNDDDDGFRNLVSSERTKMEELAEKELMAGMKNFPFEKHIDEFKTASNLKNHKMDDNFFQRTTKAPLEDIKLHKVKSVTPTILYNNPQLRVPFSKDRKGPVRFPPPSKDFPKTTAKPPSTTTAMIMTTLKPREFSLPGATKEPEKDEIYLLVKYEKPKAGGKANIQEVIDSQNEVDKPLKRGRTRTATQRVSQSSTELEDTSRNVKLNNVEVTTAGYLVSESLGSDEQLNRAPLTPQPLLGTTPDGTPNIASATIGPNQSGVTTGFPVQQDRLAQNYLQLQQKSQNLGNQLPIQQNVQNIPGVVPTQSTQPNLPVQNEQPNQWLQNAQINVDPSLQNFQSPNVQSPWNQNQPNFQNLQNQLTQQNIQNQNRFFQSLQNQHTNYLNRNRHFESFNRPTSPTPPFNPHTLFNQQSQPSYQSFPTMPTFQNQNMDFTGPMGNPMIPQNNFNQQMFPQTFFNQQNQPFSQNALNQQVFLGQSQRFANALQQFMRSSESPLNQAFFNQQLQDRPESLQTLPIFQRQTDNFVGSTPNPLRLQNANQFSLNRVRNQPTNSQTFFEQNQHTSQNNANGVQNQPTNPQAFFEQNQQPSQTRSNRQRNQATNSQNFIEQDQQTPQTSSNGLRNQATNSQTFFEQDQQTPQTISNGLRNQQQNSQALFEENPQTTQTNSNRVQNQQTFFDQNQQTPQSSSNGVRNQQQNSNTFSEQNQQPPQTTQTPPRSFQSFDFVNQNQIPSGDRGNVKFRQPTTPSQQTFYSSNEQSSNQNSQNSNEAQNFDTRNVELTPQSQQNLDQTGPQQFPSGGGGGEPQTEAAATPNIPASFLIPEHIKKIPPNQGMQETVHQPDGLMVQHNAVRIRHQVDAVSGGGEQPDPQLDRSSKGLVEEPVGNALKEQEQEESSGTRLRDSYGQFVGEGFGDYDGTSGARRPDLGSAEEEVDSSMEQLVETTDPLELSRMLVHRNGGLTVEQFNKLFRDYLDKDLTESDLHGLDKGLESNGRAAGFEGNELSSTTTTESGESQGFEGGDGGEVTGSFENEDQDQDIRVQINKAGARHEPIVKIGYGSSKQQGVYKSPKFYEKLKESSSIEDDREEQWEPPEHLQEIAPSGEFEEAPVFEFEPEQQEQSVSGEPEQQQQQENSVSENPNSGHQGGLSYIKFEKFN